MSDKITRCTAAQTERYPSKAAAETEKTDRELNRALRGGQRAAYQVFECNRCHGWHLLTQDKINRMRAQISRGQGPMVRRGRGR